MVVCVVVGFFGALAYARYPWRGRKAYQKFILLPIFFPQSVLGLALHQVNQFRAGDSFREAGIVFYVSSNRYLPAKLIARNHHHIFATEEEAVTGSAI